MTLNQVPPPNLNGYPVIAAHQCDDETWLIACYRRDHPSHEYVVAEWSIHSPNEWLQGHYMSTIGQVGNWFDGMNDIDQEILDEETEDPMGDKMGRNR